jgi:hypothetical protein|nr:MAG TPA: hypothetical protein [Caudoviricetes sp.]
MEEKINVAAILKDKSQGTKLYDLLYNIDVELDTISTTDTETVVWCTNETDNNTTCHRGYSEFGTVRGCSDGLRILLPSKEMRNWGKFAWKKGDVLVNKDGDVHIIFERFADDTYCSFVGKYYLWKENNDTEQFCKNERLLTSDFQKAGKDDAQTYINTIEERLDGKLNRETLEVEKPKKPAFELGNLYVFNEEDEDGELTIIGKLIGKNESEDTLTFGNQYEIENEKFVTDQTFDLRISVHEELREATEGEAITFQEACTLWEKSKKQGKDQPPFKTFDKVLVRCGKKSKWLPAFFIRVHEGFPDWKCSVFLICSGKVSYFSDCIPFEGNEQLLGTTKDVEG